MTVMFIGMGLWFCYDGFIRYPAENARVEQLEHIIDTANKKSTEYDQATTERQKLKHALGYRPARSSALALPAAAGGAGDPVLGSLQIPRRPDNSLIKPSTSPVIRRSLSQQPSVKSTVVSGTRKGIAYVEYLLPNSVNPGTISCLD